MPHVMNRTARLDARIRAAWQAQLTAALKTPGLLPTLVHQRQELLPRFAAAYAHLRALPRRIRRALQRRWKQSLAGLALWLALGQNPALAATINVNASCTLVDAITAANTDTATGGCPAGSEADTIVLPANSTQTLTSVDNDTNGLNGLPSIVSTMTINGVSAENTIIKRDTSGPPFRIFHVSSAGDLTLDNLTIQGGNSSDHDGGGIANFGTLTVRNSTVSDNSSDHDGGGISNEDGEVTISRSIISRNFAGSQSGGIDNDGGTLLIEHSTVSANQAGLWSGGLATTRGGSTEIRNSLVADNSANDETGGIGSNGDGLDTGTLIINSTVSGNSSRISGGITLDNGTSWTLINVTIANNDAWGSPPDGIWFSRTGNRALLQSSIMDDAIFIEDGNTLSSLGNNVFGDLIHPRSSFAPQPTDMFIDPRLGDFVDTGQTGGGYFPLLPDSPAIDAIPATDPGCTGTDQRGVPRPQGAGCDIGAVEFTEEPVPRTVTIDIRPGLPANRLPLSSPEFSKPVAILSTETFDALNVDPATVRFGATGTEAAPRHVGRDNVNGDGRPELILRFRLGDTGIECGDTEAFLTGETFDGQAIKGSDAIKTVQCP